MALQVLTLVACIALAAAETEIPISHASVAKLTNSMPYMQNNFMHPMMYTTPISHHEAMIQQMIPMMPIEKTTAMKMIPGTVMPAHYNFGYDVNDPITGDQKMQTEVRHGNNVQGRYSLVESDGTKRIVDYTADAINGFNAVVSKEPMAAHIKTFLPTTNVIDNIAPVNNMMRAIMPTNEMMKSMAPATKIMETFAPATNMVGDIVPAVKSMETTVPASGMLQDIVPSINMVESNMPIMKYGSPIMPFMNQEFRMVAPQVASFVTPFSRAYMISNTQPMQHMYKSAYSTQFMK